MKGRRRVFQAFTMVIQFGLNMIVPIVMCTMFGVWLNGRYDMPLLVVFLFLIGAMAGFRNIFIMAKKIYQDGQAGESDKSNFDKEYQKEAYSNNKERKRIDIE